ncbi:MAG: HAD family hydrolase [Lachnospiraceae bacterium]|nr:HAD family hydrolase [Lachnospiraceae bacterium]
MKKNLYEILSEYELIIFDMDGTLYFQKGMQIRMALRLICHALSGKRGIRDLKLILKYRKLREEWDTELSLDEDKLFEKLSEVTRVPADTAQGIIQEWMFERPMDAVRLCRDEELVKTIDKLRAEGKNVCIYSDYPTEDKVRAVGLSGRIPQYYVGMEGIKTMKPNPSGLFYIMSCYPETERSKVIMVGDRADRDKAAADGAGIKSIILGRFKILRYYTQTEPFCLFYYSKRNK